MSKTNTCLQTNELKNYVCGPSTDILTWAHIRGRYSSAKITTSLCDPVTDTMESMCRFNDDISSHSYSNLASNFKKRPPGLSSIFTSGKNILFFSDLFHYKFSYIFEQNSKLCFSFLYLSKYIVTYTVLFFS